MKNHHHRVLSMRRELIQCVILAAREWNLVEERIAYTNGTSTTIRYHWGKDLSGTIGGAGGVGGLIYLTISNAQPSTFNLSTFQRSRGTRDSSTPQLYIPYYDNNGNILGYRDAQGNVVASYTYDAFGNTISQSGPMSDFFRHRFSTKYFDPETGLYYYGYRYYSPVLMRWLTRDPIEESGGVNLYAMCGNNAIECFDILGNARMLTGSLLALKGTRRISFAGYDYARKTIRLVNKLNGMTMNGRKLFDVKICDLATTNIDLLKKEISENADNVYIIAHGGLLINNKKFRGKRYIWNGHDSVKEQIFPDGKSSGIDISTLGANVNNLFGCFISPYVRKVPQHTEWGTIYTSSIDDYGRMYEALYNRLVMRTFFPKIRKCPVRIRIFEGENANEAGCKFAETDNVLNSHPIMEEEYYK